MTGDYLEVLRERYGPDAATRAPEGGPVHTSSIDHPDPTRPWTVHLMPAPDAPDPLDDYDPDAERTDEPDDDRPEIRTATTPREEA